MSAEDKAAAKQAFADTRRPFSLVRNTSVSKFFSFFGAFALWGCRVKNMQIFRDMPRFFYAVIK